MLFISLLLSIVGTLSGVVALAVLSRNIHRLLNISFFALAAGITLWVCGILAFLLINDNDASALAWAQLYYIGPLIIVASSAIFIQVFPSGGKINAFLSWPIVLGALILGVLIAFWPGILFKTLVHNDWGKEIILREPFYLIYSVYIVGVFYLVIRSAYRRLGSERGVYRSQLAIFLSGYSTSCVLGLIFNLFLPFVGNYQLIWVGPIASSLYMFVTAYSILKHRLFDIRLVIARSLAYFLLLITLAFAYASLVFAITLSFLNTSHSTSLHAIVSTILAVFLAFTFQPLKRFFDKITTRLFYRDAYDTQDVLDTFSTVLVREPAIKQLAHKALDILQTTLKSRFIYVHLVDGERNKREPFFAGDGNKKLDFTPVVDLLAGHKLPLVVQDEVELQNKVLYKAMQKLDIVVCAQLKTSKELIGYIIFGYKVNGSVYTDQDINLIHITADELAVALQNALRLDEISRFNATLQEEIEVATKKLQDRNRKLKELDEAKNEFIAMASHQLRTPLTSLRGYVSMTLEGTEGDLNPQQKLVLSEANDSGRRLAYMIDDLLNVSRLQAGSFSIEPQPTRLDNLVKEELSYLHAAIELRHIKLTYNAPSGFPLIKVDSNKIRQVVMNFVDNAIYYTSKGDTIEVNLIKTAKDIQLTVKDHGIGVPIADQPKLFSKFYRASNAKLKRPDGTGIGLFVAKKVIIAHGGSLILKTEEGKGSTFGFSLPLSAVSMPDTSSES
ncbi:MAG TPA: ATP-binding protein [Patescibacteria group bacterium]|nr:ATP-binding protein [Patescibacteria group bacterium]